MGREGLVAFAVVAGVAASVLFGLVVFSRSDMADRSRTTRSSLSSKLIAAIGVGVLIFLFVLWVPSVLHAAFTVTDPDVHLSDLWTR